MMEDLYTQMLNTAAACGINIIGKEHAAQLIAAVYVFGDESAVYSGKMRADIQYIQQRYGLFGGGIPDGDFVAQVAKYAHDIQQSKGKPGWLATLEDRYQVALPEYRELERPEWRE